jgi:predicted RND superfamily exporter protein
VSRRQDRADAEDDRLRENRLVRFSVTHPSIVLAAAVGITLIAAAMASRVRVNLDARTLVPIDHPALAANDAASELFHRRDTVVAGIVAHHTIADRDTLARIGRVTASVAAADGVAADTVLSIATIPQPEIHDERIVVDRLLPTRAVTNDDAARVMKDLTTLALTDGVLVSRDSTVALVTAEVDQRADRSAVLHRMQRLASMENGGGDRVVAAGTALAQATLGEAVGRDLLRLIPAVLAVIAILLGLAFRRIAPPFISLAEIGVSLVWTAGVMGLAGASVFVTTLVLPVVLIAVGVSDDIHVLRHYYAADRAQPVRERITAAFSEIVPAVTITAVSTIVGLASMAITPLAPLRVFGIYGALSIAFSTLMTFTAVPAMLLFVEEHQERARPLPAPLSLEGPIRRLLAARAITVPLLAAVVVAAVAAIALRLRVDDRWIDNLPHDSEVAQADRLLNDRMPGTMPIEFAIDAGQANSFLTARSIARLDAFETELRRDTAIGGVTSVADDVHRVRAALADTSVASVRHTAADDRDVAQAMLLLSSLRHPSLDRLVDPTFRNARVTALIHNASYPVIGRIRAAAARAGVESGCGTVTPFGDAIVSYETVRTLVSGQLVSIPTAALTDLLLLALLFRSVAKALLAVMPVIVSGVIVFGIFAACDVPVGIANSMFTGIALGAGTDFSIHLIAAHRRTRESAASGSSVLVSAAAMALGFAVLCFSRIQPTAQLGAAMSITVIACGLNAVVLIGAFGGER